MMPNPSDHSSRPPDTSATSTSNQAARTGAVPIFGAQAPSSTGTDGAQDHAVRPAPTAGAGPNQVSSTGSNASGGPRKGASVDEGFNESNSVQPTASAPSDGVAPTAPPTADTIAGDVSHSIKGLAFHGASFGLVFGLFFTTTGAIATPSPGDGAPIGFIVSVLAGGLLGALIAAGFGKLFNRELKRHVRRSTDPVVREKIMRKGATTGRGNQVRLTAKALVLFLIVSLLWAGGVALVTWAVGAIMVSNGGQEPDISSSILIVNWVAGVLGALLALIRLLRFRRSGIFAGAVAVERVFKFSPGTY